MLKQFQIIGMGHTLDSLVKAHVKAHFRRDSRTGKLVFIQNYDSKVHGKADQEIHAGKTMVIDNPKSKHHGKKAVIRGYHVPSKGNRKPYVACTVNGVRADLQPEHFKPLPGGSSTPVKTAQTQKAPTATPGAAPAAPSFKKIANLDDAKNELGLMGKGFNTPEMQRVMATLDKKYPASSWIKALDNVKDPQDLYNKYRAIDHYIATKGASIFGFMAPVKTKIQEMIIQMAQDKVDGKTTAPAVTQNTPKTAQTPPSITATPSPVQNNAPGSNKLSVGDIVEIQTGKYAGKKGKVTHMGGKYGVRVRVDVAGTGAYTKIAEYKNPDKSFKTVSTAPATPDPKSDKTRGKDKKKRKPRSDKGTGKPDEPDTSKPKPPEDPKAFLKDRNLAYQFADDKQKNLGKKLGILPIDDKSAEYIQRNMSLLNQQNNWVKTAPNRSSAGKIPRWASASFNDHLHMAQTDEVINRSGNANSPLKAVLSASKATWENAGYDYSDVESDVKEIKGYLDEAKDLHKDSKALMVINQFLAATLKHSERENFNIRLSSYWGDICDHMKSKGYTSNTPLSVLLADSTFKDKIGVYPIEGRTDKDILKMAKLFAFGVNKDESDISLVDLLKAKVDLIEGQSSLDAEKDISALINSPYATKLHEASQGNVLSRWRSLLNKDWVKQNLLGTSYYTTSSVKQTLNLLNGDKKAYVPGPFGSATEMFRNNLSSAASFNRDKIFKVADGNPAIKDQVETNAVMKRGFDNYRTRWHDTFKPLLVHKEVINNHTPAYAGITIARRKGTAEEINAKLAKKYTNAAKKAKAKKGALTDTADSAGVKAVLKSVDDKTFKMVEKRLQKSFDRSTHGGFGIKVNGVFQVGGMDVYDKHTKNAKDYGNVKFMYHGTDYAAASNIVKTGFAVPKAAKAGRMLGNGVYVTPCSSKAAQYLSPNFTRQHGTKGVMLVNKCVMGKQFNAPQHHYPGATPGYQSIYVGKGQHGILNEEHCIRDPNSVMPTFWVDVELIKP